MASSEPRRSTRASARRRAPVVDDSDGDDSSHQAVSTPKATKEIEEEDYTPAPIQPTQRKRGRPRKTPAPESSAIKPAAQPSTRRRTRLTESVEPSIADTSEPTPSETSRQSTPARTPLPAKRPRGRPPRSNRVSVTPDPIAQDEESLLATPRASVVVPIKQEPDVDGDSQFPTPKPAKSPHVDSVPPTPSARAPTQPLADITESVINDNTVIKSPSQPKPPPPKDSETPVPSQEAMPEPLKEIIVRRRERLPMVNQPVSSEKRIVITYLVMTNFKSYAGEQVVGPFHSSFSAVVGPNGSGKSNVIDSLLFVFGFRANKMRQGKISALIHNSAQHPNLDFCEVAVHFQDVIDLPNGGHEVIPDSTLIISRRAYKNNSSEYFINRKKSNFTTVTTLLREKKVDLDHKRFLILQGEVELIAQMKPKAKEGESDDGLLEYLEDIIGTSKYKTPIEESAKKVEELNEICAEKQSRVKHVEKEKNGLEDKKNKALDFLRNENELAMKKAALYQIYISEFDDHMHVTQEKVASIEARLKEELDKHQGNEEGIKQLQRQYKKEGKEYERFKQQAQEILAQKTRLEKETVKFEEKKKFLENKRKKLEKTLESSRRELSRAETTVSQNAHDIEGFAAEIEELEEQMKAEQEELDKIRASLAGKTQGLTDEIAAKQKSLEPWRAKVNEKQSAIAVAQSELDILRDKENAGAKGIAELEAKIASYEEAKEAKAAELEECEEERKTVARDIQKVKGYMEKLAQKEPALKSKAAGARAKADEARASLSATQTQGNVLTSLMRMKETGRIDGFHGRLGNLGTIDQRYDVAITTACGALDNMVVDTVEGGQQCIEHLRKNNLGRANFICLDKLQRRDLSPIQTPENVPRLFELVKPKHDKFRPAFFHALQNTLVAKDLTQANRIAYGAQRWRVVTLDGQLIEKSGAMTGGGTTVRKGGMSSKLVADVSKEQVVQLEQDRDELESTLEGLQQKQRDAESTLRTLQGHAPVLETKAQKLALELDSFDRNIADSQRRIQELSAEASTSKSDKSRIAALEKSNASMEKEVSRLHAETADVEEEIKALQDKIMEIGGVKLRSQKAKVDGLKQEIDSLTDRLASTEVSKSKEEKQVAKHSKDHANATRDLEKLAAEFEKVEQDMQAHNKDSYGAHEKAEEVENALEERKEELANLKKELDEKQAEINSTRAIEIEMRNKLEENQKNLHDYARQQKHYAGLLSKLTYQNLSQYTSGGAPSQTQQPQQPKPSGTVKEEEVDAEGDSQMQDSQIEVDQQSQLQSQSEPTSLPSYSKDELSEMDKDELQHEIQHLEKANENATVDLSVLDEYLRRANDLSIRTADLATALAARDAERATYTELTRLRTNNFKVGFDTINERLKQMYEFITMGGTAELELEDSMDAFSEGVKFSVRPPNKTWKNISNLSGGEKTLSSLALVFALHAYKPTPLYVMDEIDAALDFRNVSIVAEYIKKATRNAQFIVISLRNNMFEQASRLVGVYKVNHMTKSVTLENKDYLRMGRQAAASSQTQAQQQQQQQQRHGSQAPQGTQASQAS